jgi:hypothetical protein
MRPSYRRALSSYTEKNKPRLYIALYPRGGNASSSTSGAFCDSYHWAIVMGPPTSGRADPGTRFHLAHSSSPTSTSTASFARRESTHTFFFEENDLVETPSAQAALHCRIAVAKVLDADAARKVLRSLSVQTKDSHSYTCFSWVQEAFAALHRSGCLKSYFDESDWRDVERQAREYCKGKRQQGRFVDGAAGPWSRDEVSTYNAWQFRETTA